MASAVFLVHLIASALTGLAIGAILFYGVKFLPWASYAFSLVLTVLAMILTIAALFDAVAPQIFPPWMRLVFLAFAAGLNLWSMIEMLPLADRGTQLARYTAVAIFGLNLLFAGISFTLLFAYGVSIASRLC